MAGGAAREDQRRGVFRVQFRARDRGRGGMRHNVGIGMAVAHAAAFEMNKDAGLVQSCLLYTSDAADERSSVDLGGRRIIKKKKQ